MSRGRAGRACGRSLQGGRVRTLRMSGKSAKQRNAYVHCESQECQESQESQGNLESQESHESYRQRMSGKSRNATHKQLHSDRTLSDNSLQCDCNVYVPVCSAAVGHGNPACSESAQKGRPSPEGATCTETAQKGRPVPSYPKLTAMSEGNFQRPAVERN